MTPDPLDTLGGMAAKPPSRETAVAAISAGLGSAWAKIDIEGHVGGVDGDDRLTYLYVIRDHRTFALIFSITNTEVQVSYGAVIQVPPGSGRYVPQHDGPVQLRWRWDETTEPNVIDAVNFWAHLEHVFE